mgnify:CR=1 FL=1
MAEFIAAIDQGTTGTRCMILDRAGHVRGAHYATHRQFYPRPGWVEHDPLEIWQRTREVVAAAFATAGVRAKDVAAVGIANQRETTIVWNRRTGQPYCPAVVWQCTRSEEICKRLLTDGLEDLIRERTGLVVASYFSGPKLAWLLEHVPGMRADAERGEALFGTVDSWLVWNMTGGPHGGAHVTDVTNASRTMLMDLRRGAWDPQMLDILSIPRAMLPEIRPSSDVRTFGTWRLEGDGGGAALPVCGLIGDQQAALAGQCCFAQGEAKNTYGTGSFLLMHTGARPTASQSGLLSTVAYSLGAEAPCQYALEGSIAITGAAVQWLRDNLGLLSSAAESEAVAQANARKAEADAHLHEILERVVLTNLRDRYPSQLSGGEARRVAVGRAMAARPKRLLLDEPLTSLDPELKGRLLTAILEYAHETGATVLYITHDREEARAVGHVRLCMERGRIVG